MDMSFINMTVSDFIKNIINFKTVDDILSIGKEQRDKGFIYERLWDIVIKLGFCSKFPNSKYVHKYGNTDDCSLKTLDNINTYFNNEKVYSGNKGGKSDITLYNKDEDKYIFISSKFYQITSIDIAGTGTCINISKNKAIDKYGISDIIAMASKNTHLYKNYDIYLVVNNKNLVLDKFTHANKSNTFITEEITLEHILDVYDLNICFLSLKEDILKHLELHHTDINYNELYLSPKTKLDLRFHHVKVLQDIPYIKIEDIDDEKIYKYFNLNEEEIKFIENVISKTNKNIKPEVKSKTDYQIIKHKRKNYYLVENKVYSINKNKSLGELFGDYINEKVVELKPVELKLVEIKQEDIKPVELKPKKVVKKQSINNNNTNINNTNINDTDINDTDINDININDTNIKDTINILKPKKNN